jgi:quinol-cytochrome oxidoreductase complex cytochrome b subunit
MIERYLLPLIWEQGVVRLLLKPFWETVFLLFIALLILATVAGHFSRRRDERTQKHI